MSVEQFSVSNVTIYHDETKSVANGQYRGHVLLFIPDIIAGYYGTPLFGLDSYEYYPIKKLSEKTCELRLLHRLQNKLHFAELSGRTWGNFDLGVRKIINVGVDALKHKFQAEYAHPLKCKLAVIFYPKKVDLSLYGGGSKKERQLRHDETMLRILMKGAAHNLYDDENHVFVTKIVSDGDPCHRRLDVSRVISQIEVDELSGRTPLRDYVSFSDDTQIIHLLSDHTLYERNSEDYVNACLLQLADLLLGAIIRACFNDLSCCRNLPRIGSSIDSKKSLVSYPVYEMLDKQRRGRNFSRSGHYRSFTVSLLEFDDSIPVFSSLGSRHDDIGRDPEISLFLQD